MIQSVKTSSIKFKYNLIEKKKKKNHIRCISKIQPTITIEYKYPETLLPIVESLCYENKK